MTSTASVAAATNTVIPSDSNSKLRIRSFTGLKSSQSLALSKSLRAFPAPYSSRTTTSLVRAVSTGNNANSSYQLLDQLLEGMGSGLMAEMGGPSPPPFT